LFWFVCKDLNDRAHRVSIIEAEGIKEAHRMRKLLSFAAAAGFTLMVAQAPSERVIAQSASESHYEVLSPWADVDPIPLRGISARLDKIEGKKIGLFANFKRSALPQVQTIEKKLKQKYPTIQTSIFHSTLPNVDESQTVNKEKFAAWVKSVDAAIAVVGD
jgi:hypothetical protein